MYSLTIHFGPNAVAWSFLFKEETKPGEIYNIYIDYKVKNCENGILVGSDDYGQAFAIPFSEISGMLIENNDLGQEARIIRSLDQARGQARANKRASTDPEIQALMRGQGPGVLTPFSNGGFR